MTEETHKRKLRSDLASSHSDVEVASLPNDENFQLSEQDFEDISNKIENKISKRLQDAEFGQGEILRLIENISSKVDNISSASSEQICSAVRTDHNKNVQEEVTEKNFPSNLSSNMVTGVIKEPTSSNNSHL